MRDLSSLATPVKQRGAFVIEFAILSLFLGVVFLFSIDVAIKLSVRGKLDRLSYSIVSIVKERTQLYAESQNISEAGVRQLYTIASNSLMRTMGSYEDTKFGMVVEEMVDTGSGQEYAYFNMGIYEDVDEQGCGLGDNTLDAIEANDSTKLSVTTTWNRTASVYRVTLCYKTEDMVSHLIGSGFTDISSSSAILGR